MMILLANPRGFCAGVDRAIEIVERALQVFGAPVYVRHEVVHNRFVVEGLKNKGTIFVDELHEVPDDAIVIFSAHGVSREVQQEARERGLRVFDATCPLVTKVHLEVSRFSKEAYGCILIGHKGHPEVEGTMGQFDERFGGQMYLIESVADVAQLNITQDRLAYVTQTTLSMDDTAAIIAALRQRFPHIHGPKKDDICYATQNRQDAVKQLAEQADLVLVVGSLNSSNSNRLKEVAERIGTEAYLIDDESGIDKNWLENKNVIGITAGASAPEVLVSNVIARLQDWGGGELQVMSGRSETITFSIPRDLQKPA